MTTVSVANYCCFCGIEMIDACPRCGDTGGSKVEIDVAKEKLELLEMLRKHRGSVARACAEAQVTTWRFLQWSRSDSEFDKAVADIQEAELEKLRPGLGKVLEKFRQ